MMTSARPPIRRCRALGAVGQAHAEVAVPAGVDADEILREINGLSCRRLVEQLTTRIDLVGLHNESPIG